MSELVQPRILALNVHPRSFGFVVFEGPTRLLDWGAKSVRGNTRAGRMPLGPKVAKLLVEYAPTVIVFRRPITKKSGESVDKITQGDPHPQSSDQDALSRSGETSLPPAATITRIKLPRLSPNSLPNSFRFFPRGGGLGKAKITG